MLILSRQNGEQLHIETKNGKVINLLITNQNGRQVRISFNAPKSHCTLHKELVSNCFAR